MGPIKYANLELFEHDKDEVVHGEVSRHQIGIFFILLNMSIIIIALSAVLFLIAKYQNSVEDFFHLNGLLDITVLASVLIGILMFLILLGSLSAMYVYHHNYFVLTDQKLIVVQTKNVFRRKISQLSIGDIQDVTVDQRSLLSRLFNYGTIKIETAGELGNFNFPYAPNPFVCSKSMVEAHEKNLQLFGN